MFNNSEKKDQVRKSSIEIKKSVWKLEVEDDIYIITIYLSAIIIKGKITVTVQMIPPKNLFRLIMHYLNDSS